jgi:hypothetical protein
MLLYTSQAVWELRNFVTPNSKNDAANDKGTFRYLQEDKIARKLK